MTVSAARVARISRLDERLRLWTAHRNALPLGCTERIVANATLNRLCSEKRRLETQA